MQPSKEQIKEFRDIYKKEFGEEIDEKTARETAERLLGFFELLYKIKNKHEPRKQNS